MMRHSNYIFTKGSIVFVKYPPSSPNAFLNGRPLIVVSNPTHILRTLVVCTTGTQDKPGIGVSFWNHADKCYVGDAEISNIYPYSMMTIYTDKIVSSIGQLDPFIMKEVDRAIDFHMGRSDIIPNYLMDHSDYICSVSHNNAHDKYITKEHVSEEFEPPYKYRKEHRKDHVNSEGRFKRTKKTAPTVPQILTNDDIMAWVNEAPAENIDLSKICREPSVVIQAIDEKSVNLIVSRAVPISLVAKKYKINQRTATFLRITLTNISIRLGINLINGKLTRSSFDVPADYIYIGMALAKAFAPDSLTGSETEYSDEISRVSHFYKINTEDRRTWKSVESFYCT